MGQFDNDRFRILETATADAISALFRYLDYVAPVNTQVERDMLADVMKALASSERRIRELSK